MFNLSSFMWKGIFVPEDATRSALGQILESNTNSNWEEHMLVSREMLITRMLYSQYSMHQESTYTWLSAALTLSPHLRILQQQYNIHTYTKHPHHLKIECVTHLHEVASHPYSSSVAERDRVALDLECRSEGSCVHICRRLLFSGRVQHCVDSNTTDAVFHLEWSVSVRLSVHLLCSSLPVLFSPS
jgi:hypothetical protein